MGLGPVHWTRELTNEVGQLADREQTAIRLVYAHRLPLSEVAAWLGIRPDEMSRLLSAALRNLGAALAPRAAAT